MSPNDTSSNNIIIMTFIIFIVLFVTITLKNIVIIRKTTALIIYPLKYINALNRNEMVQSMELIFFKINILNIHALKGFLFAHY